MNRSILSPVKYSPKSAPAIVGEVFTNYVRPALSTLVKISNSRDSLAFFKKDWDGLDHFETFKGIFLSRSHHIIGFAIISIGGTCGTVVDPKILFQKALACNASGMILCHNHPSGNNRPSQHDIEITKRINTLCKAMDMQLLDHMIITSDNSYYSFADEGNL